MSFRLCVVGHKETISLVTKIAREYFLDVEVQVIEFGNDINVDAVAGSIKRTMDFCDGILYSRRSPYFLMSAEIASKAKISLNTISKIYEASLRRGSNLFTAAELSEILGVTTRSVNRIIERLCYNNYGIIAGEYIINQKGRPSRVIQILM